MEVRLFPWQLDHAHQTLTILKTHGVALNASFAGAGKSYIALWCAQQLNLSVYIIAPKSLHLQWRRLCTEYTIRHQVTNIERSRLHGVPKHKNTLVILDECHNCCGIDTLNSKLLIALKQSGVSLLLLSATLSESPLKMQAPGYALGLHSQSPADKNFFAWAHSLGCRRWPNMPGLHFNGKPEHLVALHSQIFPDRGARLRREDIPGFPAVTNTVALIEGNVTTRTKPFLTQVVERRLELAEQLTLNPEDEAPLAGPEANTALADLLFCRMEAEVRKAAPIAELARDAVDEGQSVCIFVNFRISMKCLHALLPKAGLIFGGQTGAERQDTVDAFQADQLRVLIATIEAGGVGLSLHDVTGRYPRLSLISPSWRAVSLVQAAGRINRAGARSPAMNKMVFLNNSIEEQVAKRVSQKIQNLSLLNDGDLSPDFVHSTERTDSIS